MSASVGPLPVLVAIGGDHALVDTPGRLDLDVSVTGQAHDVEGIHHRDRVRNLLRSGGLERRLRPTLDHVQQPCWAGAIAVQGEVDDHGDVLVSTPGVALDVLIDANDLHALKPRGVVDQQPLAFSQDRVVGGVPAAPSLPHRRHHRSGSTTRHASTARSGSSRCPVTLRPRPSSRAKAVRSGRPKPAGGVASDT